MAAELDARVTISPGIVVDRVAKHYERGATSATALRDVSLSIQRGSFTTIVGRSGSGKSTLLRILAGLVDPTVGSVTYDGVEASRPRAEVRYVFQDYGQSLFPWRRVAGNVAFGAKHGGVPRAERAAAAAQALELVGLSDAAGKYPWELSGGMQQRVAIARALASRPKVLLMDEPFGAVDALSRTTLQDVLLDIWRRLELTIVLVTHDIDEAVYLADRVLAMDPAGVGFCADVDISLPRPRSQVSTRESEEFLRHRRELLQVVMGG
jgi:NitT/TauT family transport system ATP-binding protein